MRRQIALFAAMSMLPAMFVPSLAAKEAQAQALEVVLCSGGMLSVPLKAPVSPGSGSTPCCAKGCHSGASRKRLDRTQ